MNPTVSYDQNPDFDRITEPYNRFDEFKKFISNQYKLGNILEIQGCNKCKGNGLNHPINPLITGTKEDYCTECKGTGISKLELKTECGLYICKQCLGYGFKLGVRCSKCKGVGFADWIDNILGD
jgi:DnaJ-class molecular chaperone